MGKVSLKIISERTTQMEKTEDNVDDANYDPEEEKAEGNWKIVDLPEMTMPTGEENEEELFKYRSKLYRWNNKEWKERATGEFRFLKNKQNNKIRCLVRQEVTGKIMCNFYVYGEGLCKLSKMPQNENSWVWTCYDQSDDVPAATMFAIRFTKKEHIPEFEKAFNESYESNNKLDWGVKKAEATEEKKEEEPKAE